MIINIYFFTDDHSRVVLHRDNQDESDYINASFIDVSNCYTTKYSNKILNNIYVNL